MNPTTLRLSNLRFGNIDARNEVITRDVASIRHFRESFLAPTGINIDEFIAGTRFFIYGMKGAGKTAFLRYISLQVQDHSLTKFVSFASTISEEERKRIADQSNITIFEQGEEEIDQSAVNVWLLFIFKQIANLITENALLFTSNRETKTFCELIEKFHKDETKGLLTWLIARPSEGVSN